MGAEEIALSATLVKTDQGDTLRLVDGQTLKLAHPLLGGIDGQEVVVAVVARHRYQLQKQELARQLLLEIVNHPAHG